MKCEYCGKEYKKEQSLEDHKNANHWKELHPKKRGKPSKRGE